MDNKQFDRLQAWVVIGLTISIILAAFAIASALGAAHAKNWDHDTATPEDVQQWYAHLMQPDQPLTSCCGEADAYWADSFKVGPNGEWVAIITDERSIAGRRGIPVGTEIIVPPNKLKYDEGNPTGHGVIFLGFDDEDDASHPTPWVYCYVTPGGV